MKTYRIFLCWDLQAENEMDAVLFSRKMMAELQYHKRIERSMLDDAIELVPYEKMAESKLVGN